MSLCRATAALGSSIKATAFAVRKSYRRTGSAAAMQNTTRQRRAPKHTSKATQSAATLPAMFGNITALGTTRAGRTVAIRSHHVWDRSLASRYRTWTAWLLCRELLLDRFSQLFGLLDFFELIHELLLML